MLAGSLLTLDAQHYQRYSKLRIHFRISLHPHGSPATFVFILQACRGVSVIISPAAHYILQAYKPVIIYESALPVSRLHARTHADTNKEVIHLINGNFSVKVVHTNSTH